jgi:hypothetical protein
MFEGKFKNNKRHGIGRFTWALSMECYEGQWKDDR